MTSNDAGNSSQNGGQSQMFFAKPPAEIHLGGPDTDRRKIWAEWIQQYNWYKVAADIELLSPEKQAAIFMNCLGSEVLPTYKSFNLSVEEQKDTKVLIAKFEEAFSPATNTTFNTFEFLNIKQLPDECFNDFYSRLQIAVKPCKFNETVEGMTTEQRLLRDKIVMGVHSDEIRKVLLTDPKLTLDKAIFTNIFFIL